MESSQPESLSSGKEVFILFTWLPVFWLELNLLLVSISQGIGLIRITDVVKHSWTLPAPDILLLLFFFWIPAHALFAFIFFSGNPCLYETIRSGNSQAKLASARNRSYFFYALIVAVILLLCIKLWLPFVGGLIISGAGYY